VERITVYAKKAMNPIVAAMITNKFAAVILIVFCVFVNEFLDGVVPAIDWVDSAVTFDSHDSPTDNSVVVVHERGHLCSFFQIGEFRQLVDDFFQFYLHNDVVWLLLFSWDFFKVFKREVVAVLFGYRAFAVDYVTFDTTFGVHKERALFKSFTLFDGFEYGVFADCCFLLE
jgi:hypothetical protein